MTCHNHHVSNVNVLKNGECEGKFSENGLNFGLVN